MTRRASAAALLFLLAAGAAGAQQGGTDLQIPERVGDFRRTGMQEANPGYMARFEVKPGRYLDAYFYGYPRDASCGDGCDTVAVKGEADAVPQMIPMLLANKLYERLEMTSDSAIAVQAGRAAWRGRHVTMRGTRDGADVVSHFYLVSAGWYLVKVRATNRPDPATDAEIAAFLADLAPMLADQDPGCPDGPYAGQGLAISVDMARAPAEIEEILRREMRGAGFALRADAGSGRVATLARWTWGDGAAQTSVHPGVRVVAEVKTKGDGSAVSITSMPVCRITGSDAGKEQVVAMTAALEIAAALSRATEAK